MLPPIVGEDHCHRSQVLRFGYPIGPRLPCRRPCKTNAFEGEMTDARFHLLSQGLFLHQPYGIDIDNDLGSWDLQLRGMYERSA